MRCLIDLASSTPADSHETAAAGVVVGCVVIAAALTSGVVLCTKCQRGKTEATGAVDINRRKASVEIFHEIRSESAGWVSNYVPASIPPSPLVPQSSTHTSAVVPQSHNPCILNESVPSAATDSKNQLLMEAQRDRYSPHPRLYREQSGSESQQACCNSPHPVITDDDIFPTLSSMPSNLRSSVTGEGAPRELVLEGSSAEATACLLHRVCKHMKGSIQIGCTLVEESIRRCSNSAVAEVTTRFGSEVTVAFFANRSRMEKHLRMYGKHVIKEFMPVIVEHREGGQHTEAGMTVNIPSHIVFERCTTMHEALGRCHGHRERLQEIFTVLAQLNSQLHMQHERCVVLRDITPRNVVRSNVGTTTRWTFLEYCAATRSGVHSRHMRARTAPPEVAQLRLAGEPAPVDTAFDMWQLGIFLYEASSLRPYWDEGMTDEQILQTLANEDSLLPHELHPVNVPFSQRVVTLLLTRKRSNRLRAEDLTVLLQNEAITGTLAATINAGYVQTDSAIELPS